MRQFEENSRGLVKECVTDSQIPSQTYIHANTPPPGELEDRHRGREGDRKRGREREVVRYVTVWGRPNQTSSAGFWLSGSSHLLFSLALLLFLLHTLNVTHTTQQFLVLLSRYYTICIHIHIHMYVKWHDIEIKTGVYLKHVL